MSSHKRNYTVLLTTLLALAVGAMGGIVYSHFNAQRQIMSLLNSPELQHLQGGRGGTSEKLESTLYLIENYYVDTVLIDTLIEPLMPELVKRLDPHSAYIPAKELSRYNEALDGEFDGIGVVFNMATDTVIILNVISGGGSSKAGVMMRDRIIKINDTLVAGQSVPQDEIMRKLRGTRGTKVMLGIERAGLDDLLQIEVTRDKVPILSINSTFMIEPGVGYIRLDQFSRNTYREFLSAIATLKREGMTRLIFDLRGNSGGFMDQAILLAGEFLPKNALIVYTEDRNGRQDRQFNNRSGSLQEMDVVVLIDEGSASSSEILAGALQDNDVGNIVGRRSFGKGLVQQQIPFSDGSAIRLTIARYYTPTGRSIQRPYEMGSSEEYDQDLLRRFEHEELYTADSILFVDSLRRMTPGGKVVYGGGGIMPDIFVPLSQDTLPKYFRSVAGRNIIYRYTIDYSDRHRDAMAGVETLSQLDSLLDSDGTLVDDFILYAEREGIEGSQEDIEASRDLLEMQLRAFIGRNTSLGDNGYYANIYPLDDVLMAALNLEKQIE